MLSRLLYHETRDNHIGEVRREYINGEVHTWIVVWHLDGGMPEKVAEFRYAGMQVCLFDLAWLEEVFDRVSGT